MYFILLFETGNELLSLPASGKSDGHQEQNFRWEIRCSNLHSEKILTLFPWTLFFITNINEFCCMFRQICGWCKSGWPCWCQWSCADSFWVKICPLLISLVLSCLVSSVIGYTLFKVMLISFFLPFCYYYFFSYKHRVIQKDLR